MDNWKITQKDLDQLEKIQKKLDEMRTRYVEKYGIDEDTWTENSNVAQCLSAASSSLEEIREQQTHLANIL